MRVRRPFKGSSEEESFLFNVGPILADAGRFLLDAGRFLADDPAVDFLADVGGLLVDA